MLVKATGKHNKKKSLRDQRRLISSRFSGGPLMVYDTLNKTWILGGITSYGSGCAQAKQPGVYTRVSMFIDWIDQHTNSASIMQFSLTMIIFWIVLTVIFRNQ